MEAKRKEFADCWAKARALTQDEFVAQMCAPFEEWEKWDTGLLRSNGSASKRNAKATSASCFVTRLVKPTYQNSFVLSEAQFELLKKFNPLFSLGFLDDKGGEVKACFKELSGLADARRGGKRVIGLRRRPRKSRCPTPSSAVAALRSVSRSMTVQTISSQGARMRRNSER